MPNYCVAVGCKNMAKKGSEYSFHRFPHQNPNLLKKWVHAIRRKQWKPTKHSFICSDHFHESCFVIRPGAEAIANAKQASKQAIRYNEHTKQFALTLHYYSPRAYDFVHQVLLLPHPSCIQSWAASVDCEPGFLCDVISFLGNAAQNNAVLSDVVLIVDPMAIRKGTWWDAKQIAYVGRVDYGTGMPEADDDLATEALVFMISGVSGHWKHPIGYFLQNKMSASVQAQLIKDCIGLLSAEKLNVVALVFDGSFTNQSTAVKLGCKMSVSDLQTWFLHPETDKKIHVIFDVCHMVKLLRNLLVDKKVICHEQNGKLEEISWWYIESLNRLQEDLGFSFANKLKNQHIEWTRHKMNVSLAAQTLSSSVAAAIDFLRKESQMENFAGSEATTDFIRKVDLAFDLLNSRNPLAKGTWSISIPKHVRTFF